MGRGASTALERELEEVTSSVVRMISRVREQLGLARRALLDADVDAAEAAVSLDGEVDADQHALEDRILAIIARRQPAAKDLRLLTSVFQSLSDVERCGDYAAHVARAGAELAKAPPLKKYLDMKRILVVLDEMLETTIRGLVEADAATARAALTMDDEIDELFDQIQRELLTYMMADPAAIDPATKLLAVARHLERCGDHVENVNEHVLFWLTGRRI